MSTALMVVLQVELQVATHQVVEGGALLLAAHVFEETVVGHQQQSAGVLQVVVGVTPPSEHHL